MDFAATLRRITAFLEEQDLRWALIGGLALSAYGSTRNTLDLDLAVDGEAQDQVIAFMESVGFETLYRSLGYSNHRHPDEAMGRVDFVYVRGETSARLFAGTGTHAGPGGLEVHVPRPEHLIAMKVVAMKNDPDRTFQEMADIRQLLRHPSTDRDEVRGFFARHDLLERYRELEESL